MAMIQETFLRMIVFARLSFRPKPESRLNEFGVIPARAQRGRDDADVMDLSLETTGRGTEAEKIKVQAVPAVKSLSESI